jgi:hypothetical protein
MIKKILLVLIIVLIAIQFIRPQKNVHPAPQTARISTIYAVPADVDTILAKACNDCHSNNTRYPWYNNIQPVAWWLKSHVDDGRSELNFDEFASYRAGKQYHKLEEVKEQIEKDEMPLSSYTLIHTDAKLTDAEKQALINWSEGIRKQMQAKYPKDSLEKKPSPQPHT